MTSYVLYYQLALAGILGLVTAVALGVPTKLLLHDYRGKYLRFVSVVALSLSVVYFISVWGTLILYCAWLARPRPYPVILGPPPFIGWGLILGVLLAPIIMQKIRWRDG